MYNVEISDETQQVMEKLIGMSRTNENANKLLMEIVNYLKDLKQVGPKVGTKLEDKFGIDLSACYKIYCLDAEWRIIYEPLDQDTIFVHIIGPRSVVYDVVGGIKGYFKNEKNGK